MEKIVREEAWDVDDDDNKVLGSRWAIALLALRFLLCCADAILRLRLLLLLFYTVASYQYGHGVLLLRGDEAVAAALDLAALLRTLQALQEVRKEVCHGHRQQAPEVFAVSAPFMSPGGS